MVAAMREKPYTKTIVQDSNSVRPEHNVNNNLRGCDFLDVSAAVAVAVAVVVVLLVVVVVADLARG